MTPLTLYIVHVRMYTSCRRDKTFIPYLCCFEWYEKISLITTCVKKIDSIWWYIK